MQLRVFLAGRVAVESDSVVIDDGRFPGRQGRLLFAYLVAEQARPVPRDELAEALWGEAVPATWEKALSVLVSKLRALLNECGVDGLQSLTTAFGCYQLTLPAGSWIDVAAAEEAVAAADHALAEGDLDGALVNASTAAALARRTFLPGEDGRWVEQRRAELRETLLRALESLAEAYRLTRDAASAVRAAEELVILEPFRDSGYRLLMQAQSAAGNDAEALRTYERCRTLLADELGAFPSPETEAVYLEILRGSPRRAPGAVHQLDLDGPRPITSSPPIGEPPKRGRRTHAALAAAGVLVGAVAAAGYALTSGDRAPPEVLPNSMIRIDPNTLETTRVVQVEIEPDLVVIAGGFVWITHRGRGYTGPNTVRNSGDRVLTRIDTSTGDTKVVGGGLAPCGLTADPSGDVWVANCFSAGSGVNANVVRVDAKTLEFEATWPVPAGEGYFRGLAYGGGSLWVADVTGAVDYHGVTKLDPRTGARSRIEFDRHAGWLAWSDGYGDLWANDFDRGSLSRLHAATGVVKTFESVTFNPTSPVVFGDSIWVGDWAMPQLVRLPAVGSGTPHEVDLPTAEIVGVTNVAAGAGSIWATLPDSHALWRINPQTNRVTRIPIPYYPWGVAAADDEIWVAVRAKP